AGDQSDIDSFIRWMRTQNPCLEDWLNSANMISDRWLSISEVPFVPKRPVINDVIMAGDAAGLIAPLAGDGIAMALHSGQIAGSFASRFLNSEISGERFFQAVASAWRSQFQARLRLSWALQPLMFHPVLSSIALNIIRSAPP